MTEGKETPNPIPPLFCKSDTRQPFDGCLMCQQSLKNETYVVEKVIRNHRQLKTQEIIFEYAMCLNCANRMRMELSEESRGNIEAYMAEKVNLESRNKSPEHKSVDDYVSTCVVKNTPVSQSAEFSIYALCQGNEMVYGELPYALSGEAMEEINSLLSAKTLEVLDDFIGNYFSGPPEVREILKRRPVLI